MSGSPGSLGGGRGAHVGAYTRGRCQCRTQLRGCESYTNTQNTRVAHCHCYSLKWETRHKIAKPMWKVRVKVAQLCPTLCDPVVYTVNRILQARILEWVTFPFSRRSFQPRNQTRVSWIASGFFTNWATKQNELDHINKIHRQSFKINTERLTVVFMAFSSFSNFPPLALTYKVTGESIPTKSVSNAFSFLTWRTKLWWEMAFSTLLYWDFPGCPALKI